MYRIKLGLDPDIELLITIFLTVLLIGLGVGCISFACTVYTENLFQKELCFTNGCLGYFFSKNDEVIKVFQLTAWLLTFVATIGGIIVALLTYKSGLKNSSLTNHISHLNMFREYVNAEISKRTFMSSDKINLFKWYNLMFPNSKSGDVTVSHDYSIKIGDIKSVIESANQKISNSGERYIYNNHQIDLISKISFIGIKMSTGPKNEFILIEEQVFDLIDCINITFTNIGIELSSVPRKYI